MKKHLKVKAELTKDEPPMVVVQVIEQTHRKHLFGIANGRSEFVLGNATLKSSACPQYVHWGGGVYSVDTEHALFVTGSYTFNDNHKVSMPLGAWNSIKKAIQEYNRLGARL